MLKLILLFCFITFAASPLVADETHVIDDVWFELADCYEGEAVFAVVGNSEDQDWKRVEFALCAQMLSMRSYRLESDGGETLYDERYADDAESITIYHEHSSVRISSRFRETLTDAGERDISPMRIQRLIAQRRDDLGLHVIERHDDSTVTVGFTLTTQGQTEQHEFDVLGRRITACRSIQRGGRYLVEVRYDGWQELDDGQPIPTRMHSRNGFGADEIVMKIRVESARSMTAAQTPARPSVPPRFVIQQAAEQDKEPTPSALPEDEQRSMPRSGNSIQGTAAPITILAGGAMILIVAMILVLRYSRA
jgi:hypothetical protein